MGQEQQLRRMATSRKSTKSPPIFSQEFIMQNHADIMSCVAMLFVAGLMFQVTSPLASMFVVLQNNVSSPFAAAEKQQAQPQDVPWLYAPSFRDLATIFFYTIICIIAHAVIQEYGVDKLQRKVHLSKTKTAKFNESGQLVVFALVSAGFAGYVISQEDYLANIPLLWQDYPSAHRAMPFLLKLFYIFQIAYWLHTFPEFYFQKSKKEEIRSRTITAIIYLIFIGGAYVLNFTRVGLCILALHYAAEFVFHVCRLTHFAEKKTLATPGFKFWNVLFVFVRLGCACLAVLTFWYGLRTSEVPSVDLVNGNFNTTFIRLNCLLVICGLQAWLMWNFINFHLRRVRERSAQQKPRPSNQTRAAMNKRKAKKLEHEVRNLPEADQDATRALHSDKKRD